MTIALNADDRRWQREEDARTLARAEEIIANKRRHNAAVSEAKKMVKAEELRALAMKKVARKKKPIKKITKKKVVRKKVVKKR